MTLISLLPFALLLSSSLAQNSSSGYTDYSLTISGDSDSVLYETASTDANSNSSFGPPDVFLNASVHVGEIDLLVANLSAKINLDAQVLNLLSFNAGVDVEIGRVNLQIQNVTAKVLLEARLENLVLMINDTLNSIDLNPIIAQLGDTVGTLTGDLGSGLTGSNSSSSSTSSNLTSRSTFEIAQGILYSINDYSGSTHTNRILEQNGQLVDQSLDNEGHVYNAQVVGDYTTDMTFTGYERDGVVVNGMPTTEREYKYEPYVGLSVIAAVFTDASGTVVATRVISELEGGGRSSISGEGD